MVLNSAPNKFIDFLFRQLHKPLDYIASPSTVIPMLLLLILIIYYLVSLTGALREANQDLKDQLRLERTEGRKKLLKLGESKSDENDNGGNPMDRWRKVLEVQSNGTDAANEQTELKFQARKGVFRITLRVNSI